MTIMNTELYEALVAAGAPDDKAKAAANVVEEQNKRFDQIDTRFDKLQSEIDNRFDKMQSDMDNRFDKVDHKIEHLETRLMGEIGKLDAVMKIILGISLTTMLGIFTMVIKLLFFP